MSGTTKARWPHAKRPDARQLLTGGPVLFDTMILTALVTANRAQMLVESMAGRARIVPRVGGELRGRSRGNPAVAALIPPQPGQLRTKASFGEMVTLTRAEAIRAADLQRAWNGKAVIDADEKKDRGEAECVAVAIERKWLVVSQDHHAVGPPWNRRQFVFGLPELLMLFAAEGRCLGASAWAIYDSIASANVALVAQDWPCDSTSETTFAKCCEVMSGAARAA